MTLIEAWAGEAFSDIIDEQNNQFSLTYVLVQRRPGIADIISQFGEMPQTITACDISYKISNQLRSMINSHSI